MSTDLQRKAFYEKFDAVRSKLSLPEISWKLHCDQNYKLSEYPKILSRAQSQQNLIQITRINRQNPIRHRIKPQINNHNLSSPHHQLISQKY